MKQIKFLHVLLFLFAIAALNSCTVIEGIFKAGMGFGIFIVVAIVALVVFFLMRMGKSKN